MLEIPQDIKKSLSDIGLDRAEIQVCVLLLKKNFLSIQEITNEVKLPRSSVQLACENLLNTGVLKVSITGKRRSFYIENAHSIEQHLSQKEKDIQSQKITLQSILPKLSAIQAIAQDAEPIEIEELSGEDGFVETFYRSLNQPKNSEVLRFTGNPETFTVAREKLKQYREQRMKKKIYSKVIHPESSQKEEEARDAVGKMREVRFLPKELYNPKVQMSTWQNNVAVTVWDKGLHSIIIKNKAFADSMKQLFTIAWNQAKN